ncbi:MAG: ATP-grasp domain-containing protein [Mesorhizobium sp.]|nr:MAG: ATP-grasp domain-containing protein [Mesorhizobium sp.]
MARRALILIEGHPRGNGLLQVQAAKRLGLHPITLSANPAQYDYIAMERIEAIRVDTDDLSALIRECSRLGQIYSIAGITCALEKFCVIAAKLCRHFALPGPNPASIEQCCDKFAQRQHLAEAGVPVPVYHLAADAADLKSSAMEIGLPVVLKPAVGSGSRGVRLCSNIDEVAEHAAFLLSGKHVWGSSPRVLVEEFANGPLYSAIIMGNFIAIGTLDFGPPPYFVYRSSIYPAPLSDYEHERIADVSLSCLRALGLGWGPTGVELRWTKRGPVVIEVNPRLGGSPDPQMIKLAYGVDLITEHIKLVIGDECDLRIRHSHTAATRYLVADRDGTLDWIAGDSQAAAVAGVAEVKLYVQPKTPIVRSGDVRDCLGHVIAASPTHEEGKAILQRAVDLIDWSITSVTAEED